VNEMPRVYYDGRCHLCSREIEHYRRCAGSEALNFVDITHPDFSADAEGLDVEAINRHLHVRRADGSLAVGVDAFIEIWTTLPKYRRVAAFARVSVVKGILEFGYRGFARIRPYLPKRATCENNQCSIDPKKAP